MERNFSASWASRASTVFMLLICAGAIAFGCYVPFVRPFGPDEAWLPVTLMGMFFGMGGGLGAFMAWGLLETFTNYTVDEVGVTRSSLFGRQTMAWRDIADYSTRSSGERTTYLLTDVYGGRMRVYVGLFARPAELLADMQRGLEPIRARREQAVTGDPVLYDQPPTALTIGLGIFILVFGLAIACGSIWLAMNAGQTHSPAFALTISCLGVGMGLLFSVYAAPTAMTSFFRITQTEICRGSIFGRKLIPFSEISAVYSRDLTSKNGTFNTTYVTDRAGKTISFMETIPNYARIVEIVRSKAGQAAQEAGAVEAPRAERKTLYQSAIITGIVLPPMLAFAVWYAAAPATRLQQELEIDRLGTRTEAQVVGRHTERADKATLCFVEFDFRAEGRSVEGASQIPEERYYRSRPGDRISVDYVPGRPNHCRAVGSIGKRTAIVLLGLRGFYVAIGVLGLVSTIVTVRKRLRQLAPSGVSGSSGSAR